MDPFVQGIEEPVLVSPRAEPNELVEAPPDEPVIVVPGSLLGPPPRSPGRPIVVLRRRAPLLVGVSLAHLARGCSDRARAWCEQSKPEAQHQADACSLSWYMPSMMFAYFSVTTLRLTFMVGVSSPVSTVKGAGRTSKYLICW